MADNSSDQSVLKLSGVLAAFVPAFAFLFTSFSDFFQSDREVNLQRLQEDRARVAEFVTGVSQRRAAVANLNASLKRGFDAFEITERKRAYESAYIDSADTLYRMQNLVRTAISPPKEARPALQQKWGAPGSFLDAHYNALISNLSLLDGIAQDRYECWVLEARANPPPETAAAGLVKLTPAELATARTREKCLPATATVADAAPPSGPDVDKRFKAASTATQLCMNQLAVEVYRLRSARRGQSLTVVWSTVRGRREDWNSIFDRINAFCPKPPPASPETDTPAAVAAWTAAWNAYMTAVSDLQTRLPDQTGKPKAS